MPENAPDSRSMLGPVTRAELDDWENEYERGRQAGIRQAVAWLQADYQYGDMPEWRQSGVDWIEDRARDERVAHSAPSRDSGEPS